MGNGECFRHGFPIGGYPDLPQVSPKLLEVKSQGTEEPPGSLEGRKTRQPFIELVIRYLRPADRRNYEKRAYYFVSQDRKWVAENHPGSKTEINEQVKNYLRRNPSWASDYRPGLDLTHDVKVPTSKNP